MSGWKYAFSLSKAEVKDATPPGTVRLVDHHVHDKALEAGYSQPESPDSTSSSSNDEIVRFPKPSADPADPLNWASWRKVTLLLTASSYAFIGNFASSGLAPALQAYNTNFPTDPQPFSQLTQLVAVSILMMGASNIFWVPLSNIFGRRPVLLVATLLMTLSSMWGGLAPSFNSLLASRIFQGAGAGPSETTAPALIGEIFFLDSRGRAMAVYTTFLSLGSIIGGITGSYIAFHHGWAYVFWVSTALSAACFVGMLLFVPETLYSRRDEASPRASRTQQDPSKVAETMHVESFPQTNALSSQYRPFIFVRSLGFGAIQRGNTLACFVQPWKTLALPGTWVVMLHYAGLVGGIVTISTIGAQLVSQPPYLWGANSGLINVGPIIGALIGAAFTYISSDARFLGQAKHEGHGFAEPETRLPTSFPGLIIATSGLFVFGFCAQYPGPKVWVGLEVGYAMLSFGLMQVPSIDFNYLIDSYSHVAGDCFVIVTILRSIISFAWTYFVADWVAQKGPAEPFGIFGMMLGIFSLLTIPLWLFGKRMRIATAGHLDIRY
ncbi:major facilitator superfamily transporter [Diaporthe helianthi]|uniref:Major facilitator superfamily transporter n=1 Tax=Diaporthe helianthi TaxID=158607 RepID=A0A2P5HEL2_DIAHE|nr:major facilitator superfamily transporter [Diaporthe helianthi]